jgi:hypothetical protein
MNNYTKMIGYKLLVGEVFFSTPEATASILAVGLTQTRIHWVPVALSWGVKLTTLLDMVPKLRIIGRVIILCIVCTGTTLC